MRSLGGEWPGCLGQAGCLGFVCIHLYEMKKGVCLSLVPRLRLEVSLLRYGMFASLGVGKEVSNPCGGDICFEDVSSHRDHN